MSILFSPEDDVQPDPDPASDEATEDGESRPRRSTFGGAANDPISSDELRLMMGYLLRNPDAARVAAENLPEGQLVGLRVDEIPAELLWDACRKSRGRVGSHPPLDLVRVEALRAAAQDYPYIAEGVQADVEDLYEYVRRQPESTFADSSAGLALLRHFLTERWLRSDLRIAADLPFEIDWAALGQIRERIQRFGHASTGANRSLQDGWPEYENGLARYRGRALVGIATGWPSFDRLTLGLRGVMLLTSRPGAGKSSFFGHALLGAVRHNPDVCGVYVSLEMDRETILQRVHAHLAGLPLPTVLSGSPELHGRDGLPAGEPYFTDADQAKLDRARDLIGEFGSRLLVLGRQDLGPVVSVEAIRSRVDQFKRESGAATAVVVLDYLSLLDVPPEVDRNDREADKWRITQARRIVENTPTAAYPEGDALLVICESRKPATGGEGEWGEGLEDFMGSARLTYAAEFALNFRALTDPELKLHYGALHHGGRKEILAALETQHVAPLVLKITKARGASRGEIMYEYKFHEYVFSEKPHLSDAERQRRQAEREAEERQETQARVKGFVVAALRSAGESGMSRTQIKDSIGPSVQQAKIRGYDLPGCLGELVREQTLEAFDGPNPNGTGKRHPRWKLLHDPDRPVARPTRLESTTNPASRNGSRRQRRRGAAS